jgi:hypothetical protein
MGNLLYWAVVFLIVALVAAALARPTTRAGGDAKTLPAFAPGRETKDCAD